jgi:RNA polymerase sporulation-specific sigma factor
LGEIKQLFRQSGTVKVSRSIKELYLKITRLTNADSSLTISMLAEKLDTTEEKINEALNAGRVPLSLTTEEGRELDLSVNSCEEDFTEKLSLQQALQCLDTKDKQLIDLRYFKHLTQTEAGKHLNMTQVQVSRREKVILNNIRTSMRA